MVDSDVLIDVSRGVEMTISILEALSKSSRFVVSAVTQMELVIGCRDRVSLQVTQRFLARFDGLDISAEVSRQAVGLVTRYNLSHGLLMPDALIAASAIVNALPLLSKNQRDFRFIEDLNLLPFST